MRLLLACVVCVGCSKLFGGDKGDAAIAPASATVASSASAAPADTRRAIADIGDVPAWAPDVSGVADCKTTAAAKTRIKELSSGKDATVSSGKADPTALADELGATKCASTRKDLANALNDGGYERYKSKAWSEADRWWRAALVVRPSSVTPRYNLACGLALEGKPKDAVWAIQELARAAADGDASAVNSLDKAKSDADLATVREDADFKKALEIASAAGGVLVGPRKEPETSVAAVKLLPDEFRKVKDEVGFTENGWITYSPALVQVWTWHPDASTELLVATIVDDPAKLGKPKGDMNMDYGGIGVFRRDGDALKLLVAHKTGESPPAVAAKGKDVAYSYDTMRGTFKGTLTWNAATHDVALKEKAPAD